MKRAIAVMLILLCLLSLFSCDTPDNQDELPDETLPQTEAQTEAEPKYTYVDYGLNDTFDFVPKSDDDRIKEGNYVKVSDISSDYVRTESDGKIFLKYNTPQMELAGIKDPSENNGEFYRLDAKNKSKYYNLHQTSIWSSLATHTSGVTLRFRTNADEITIHAMMRNASSDRQHFSDRGGSGFDVYVGSGTDRVYFGTAGQLLTNVGQLKETVKLPGGYVEVLINFPTYAGVVNFFVGIPKDAEIAEPLERDHKAVVFYGSSITQGACASRPGTSYPNVVARMLNADCINQGYSSGAHLDTVMAEYIASLENISAVVIDNDGNGSLDTLKTKHYKFYKIIRDAHPDIPIILVTRPVYTVNKSNDDLQRILAMKNTYKKAVDEGDENIYFITGDEFIEMRALADLTTVDATHPNDLGMYYMARRIYTELNKALNKTEK